MLPGKKAPKSFIPTDVDRTGTVPVRGAKRGGLTDHLSGYHLIPNVGREAMVPGECVRRQHRPARPKEQPKPKPAPKIPEKTKKQSWRDKSPRRHRGRSRDHSKERHRCSSSSEHDGGAASGEEDEPPKTEQQIKQEEADRRRQELVEEEARKRFEEEQKKLKELENVRNKKQEQQVERKKRLGGLFALTEDDINAEEDDEANRARIAKERARAERKAQAADRPEPVRAAYSTPIVAVASVSRSSDSGSLTLVDPSAASNLTAADLDGSMHDHKFSKVWKDWDATKKSDPGEVARQFMKIAAIKRRGYAPGGRDRSRSRSDPRDPRGRDPRGRR